MIPADELHKTTSPSGGSISWTKDGETASLSWSTLSPTRVIGSSTYVPTSMRGHGVAKVLLDAFIADALAEGYRIVPTCSYIRDRGPEHPDWARVVDRADGTFE